MQQFMFILLSTMIGLSMIDVQAQSYEWEVDRIARLEQERQQGIDSTHIHKKSGWGLTLSYGPWFFSDRAKSSNEELFFLPQSMNVWHLSGAWHLNERLSMDLSFGIQLNKNTPSSPNIGSVLAGDDLQLEGSGALFLPIELGARYFLTKQKLRPFIGAHTGIVVARAQYLLAEGNLVDGINRSETQVKGRAVLGTIQAGFAYRIGMHAHIQLAYSYYMSSPFDEPIGGYENYEGSIVQIGISLQY